MTRYRIASAGEVPEGQAILADAGEQRLLVCKVGDGFCAIDDVCSHDGGPLGEGRLSGQEIECPRHGARFNVCTGRATRMPAVRPVKAYTVDVEDGGLYVEVEDPW
jgi:3-phenylpropionate/trans-cinnamate dioxygenase ferredoxin subunit